MVSSSKASRGKGYTYHQAPSTSNPGNSMLQVASWQYFAQNASQEDQKLKKSLEAAYKDQPKAKMIDVDSHWVPVKLRDDNSRVHLEKSKHAIIYPAQAKDTPAVRVNAAEEGLPVQSSNSNEHLAVRVGSRIVTVKVNLPFETQTPRESVTTAASSDDLFEQEGPIVVKLPVVAPVPTAVTSSCVPEFIPSSRTIKPAVKSPASTTSSHAPVFNPSSSSSRFAIDKSRKITSPQVSLQTLAVADPTTTTFGKKELRLELPQSTTASLAQVEMATIRKKEPEKEWMTASELKNLKLPENQKINVEEEYERAWMTVTDRAALRSAKRKEAMLHSNRIAAAKAVNDATVEADIRLSAPPSLSNVSTINDSDSELTTVEVAPELSKWALTRFKPSTTTDKELTSGANNTTSPSRDSNIKTTEHLDKWGKPLSKAILRDGQSIGGSTGAIDEKSKGHAMMTKMGWTPGTALGSMATGRLEPVPQVVQLTKRGLGAGKIFLAELAEAEKAEWEESAKAVPTSESGNVWVPNLNESLLTPEEFRNLTEIPSRKQIQERMEAHKKEKKHKKNAERLAKMRAKEAAAGRVDVAGALKWRGPRGGRYRGHDNTHGTPSVTCSNKLELLPGSQKL